MSTLLSTWLSKKEGHSLKSLYCTYILGLSFTVFSKNEVLNRFSFKYNYQKLISNVIYQSIYKILLTVLKFVQFIPAKYLIIFNIILFHKRMIK